MSKAVSGWVSLAEDRLIAFPASSAFAGGSGPLSEVGRDGQLLFGLAARMLKDGHSLGMALPCPDKLFFARLLYYLHRVRVDSLTGHVLGAWFHPETLWMRRDLIWFGKPLHLAESAGKLSGLNVCRLTRKRGQAPSLMGRSARIARTPLLPWSGDPYQLQELLVEQTDPFAFIIDATPSGVRDGLLPLWEILSVYFPAVPILVVSALGDFQTDTVIDNIPIHRWFFRLQDRQFWLRQEKASPKLQMTLVELPDTVLDSRLAELYQQTYNLNRQMDGETPQARKSVGQTAYRLVQRLSCLACPLPIREKYLERHSRRGPFAVRSLAREISILAEAPLRYGALENQRKTLTEGFKTLYGLLETGTTGKEQYLRLVVERSVSEKKSLLVLVGDSHDEQAMTETINSFGLQLVDDQRLCVRTAGSTRSARAVDQVFDCCLVLCRLWDKDFWWLAGVAHRVVWPVYPFELPWVRRRLETFEKHCISPSLSEGDKKSLVTLSWPRQAILLDRATEKDSTCIKTATEKGCSGYYPIDRSVEIERSADLTNGLTEILAAEEEAEEELSPSADPVSKDCVRIRVEERTGEFSWPVNSPLHVLDSSSNDGFVNRTVDELRVGDQFIWVEDGNPHKEILHNLFEIFHATLQTREILRWVGYWDQIVVSAAEKFATPQALHRALEKEGTSVSLATVRNWLNKKVYGPDQQSSIKNLAVVTDSGYLVKYSPQIHKAMELVWNEHRQIGRDLRQALVHRAGGATSIKVGSLQLAPQTLDEILRIYTVVSVSLPGKGPEAPRNLGELVPRVEAEFGTRILLLPKAVRSMEDSPYRDIEKAWVCFEIAAESLWGYFTKQVNFNDMREAFRQVGIEVKPGTSEVTQGMSSDYIALYEGRQVDMGPHLSIGVARDPSKTLRVHYFWDETKKLLVILHAGRHLKTRSS
jgi:hypothetical protein